MSKRAHWWPGCAGHGEKRDMAKKMIGYMVTWRTYGSWVAEETCGGRKGYGRLVQPAVALREAEQAVVKEAIAREVARQGERLEAIAVDAEHVHVVMRTTCRPIAEFVAICKTVARQALRATAFEGKVWARGYDKRFCYDGAALRDRIAYVQRHAWDKSTGGFGRRGAGGDGVRGAPAGSGG